MVDLDEPDDLLCGAADLVEPAQGARGLWGLEYFLEDLFDNSGALVTTPGQAVRCDWQTGEASQPPFG